MQNLDDEMEVLGVPLACRDWKVDPAVVGEKKEHCEGWVICVSLL
jgi:hypothetical protein